MRLGDRSSIYNYGRTILGKVVRMGGAALGSSNFRGKSEER